MIITALYDNINFELYISAEEIAAIVERLSDAVNQDFEEKNPFFIVMLNGAFMFAADFLRKITVSHEVGFVRCTSYEGMQTSGQVKYGSPAPEKVKGRHVVIIEDIIDTGNTMHFFLAEIAKFHPESVSIACLLVKPEASKHKIHIDYLGKAIENRFVVGYGLDYDDFGRNLDAIYVHVQNNFIIHNS
jgi:hypoxanthine phosphoribosyltransferase